MKTPGNPFPRKAVYYRLVAMWVACEAFLGGIIHGLKLPVSGLVVGSMAVICIGLIAWHVPSRGAILRATLVVAIFKMMLSPHSPPMAYLAVFFQGLLGSLLFVNRRLYKPMLFVFAIVAMTESALQRILVMWLVYGTNFWLAVNEGITKIFPAAGKINSVGWAAVGYTFVHCLAGLLVAVYVRRLNRPALADFVDQYPIHEKENPETISTASKRKNKLKVPFLFVWAVLLGLLMQTSFHWGTPILDPKSIGLIVLRAAVILMTWYFLIGPLITLLMRRWLERKKEKAQKDLGAVMVLLPGTKAIIVQSWRYSKDQKGSKRLLLALKIMFAHIIHHTTDTDA